MKTIRIIVVLILLIPISGAFAQFRKMLVKASGDTISMTWDILPLHSKAVDSIFPGMKVFLRVTSDCYSGRLHYNFDFTDSTRFNLRDRGYLCDFIRVPFEKRIDSMSKDQRLLFIKLFLINYVIYMEGITYDLHPITMKDTIIDLDKIINGIHVNFGIYRVETDSIGTLTEFTCKTEYIDITKNTMIIYMRFNERPFIITPYLILIRGKKNKDIFFDLLN